MTAPTSPTSRRRLPHALVAVGLVGLTLLPGPDPTPGRIDQVAVDPPRPPAPTTSTPAPGAPALSVRGRIDGAPLSGPTVTVDVTAPAGSRRMQVATDPAFLGVDWAPLAPSVEVRVETGYQEIFARFSDDAGSPIGGTIVTGVNVDPWWDVATADATSPRRPAWIAWTGPTTLTVRLDTGRVLLGSGDRADGLEGRVLSAAEVDSIRWQVSSPAGPIEVVSVSRTTRPNGSGEDAAGHPFVALVHDVTLTLAHHSAEELTVADRTGLVATTAFTYREGTSPSPAVHANQVGFAPRDRPKLAYLSPPLGVTAGAGAAAPRFAVVDDETGDIEFEGIGHLVTPPARGELGRGDLTGSPVWRLDFSDLERVGRSRVCVAGIGCSNPFEIDPYVWGRLTVKVARAMFHQRSGIALGPPSTAFARPLPFGPGSHQARQSTLTFFESERSPDRFAALTRSATDSIVADTSGGHFDAGDWDRNVQHLWYLRAVADLVEADPDGMGRITLDIPESANQIPDLLDEGLWSLDLYRRLQHDDGAVPGGVESAEHPASRTTSWTDELPLYVYAPDPWSTYVYAGAAADAAIALRRYSPAASDAYAESARRAMDWAERQRVPRDADQARDVSAQRGVAAAALLRLDGDPKWNRFFLDATPFRSGPVDVLNCRAHDLCDAAWEYWRVDPGRVDPAARANVIESFRRTGQTIAALGDSTRFGWNTEHPDVPLEWGLGLGGAPSAVGLSRAATVTGDGRYREATVRASTASLGANPPNVVFITGTGTTPVQHPLIVDVREGGLPVWPGTPVYGFSTVPADYQGYVRDVLARNGVTPLPSRAPYLWSYYDIWQMVPMNEYTVQQSHTSAVAVFGALATH